MSREHQIVVDNDTSHDFTLIEVHGEDAIGVLYRITHVLFELGLAIHVAKISSKGNKVLDVFYVQTESGAKIEAGPPTLAVRKALLAALECSFESASPAEMG